MNAVTQTNGKLQNKVSTLEVTNMDLLDQLKTTRSKVLQLELEVTKLKSKQSIVSSPEQIWVTPTRSIPMLSSTPRRSAPGKKSISSFHRSLTWGMLSAECECTRGGRL